MRNLIFFITLLLLLSTNISWSNTLITSETLSIDVEGVYLAKDFDGKNIFITILQNITSDELSLTIANNHGHIYFHTASTAYYPRENGNISITSSSVGISGARNHINFEINPATQTIYGSINANFLNTQESFDLSGKRHVSLNNLLNEVPYSPCPAKEKLTGLYEGKFTSKSKRLSQLRLRLIPDDKGNDILSGNLITDLVKILYHDSNVSSSGTILTLVNDHLYEFSGKAKKLTLLCVSTSKGFSLRGIHISSNGRVISDVNFIKVQ